MSRPISSTFCTTQSLDPLSWIQQTPLKATGVSTLYMKIGNKQVLHFASVVLQLQASFFMGTDLLVRLGTQLDTIKQILWSQANVESHLLSAEPEHMASRQTIPQACQVTSEMDITIPLLEPLCTSRSLKGSLNLIICGLPVLELNNHSTYVLVQNLTYAPIQVSAWKPLGIDKSFHDFELTVPIIGELPPSLFRDEDTRCPLHLCETDDICRTA